MSHDSGSVKSRKRIVRRANPVFETIKMVVGGGAGMFIAVLLLSYFWDIDLLGWRKKQPQEVARAPEPDGFQKLQESRAKNPIRTEKPVEPVRPVATPEPSPEPTAPPEKPVEVELVDTVPPPVPDPIPVPVPEPPADPPPSVPTEPTPVATIPPDSKPTPTRGAKVMVGFMRPVPTPAVPDLPDFLRRGITFDWIERPTAVNIELGELVFKVDRPGTVVLGANWNQRLSGGDWTKTRLTREQLIEKGWEPCGSISWPPAEPEQQELFRKDVKKGETYRIRTGKYWPPFVFLPP